MNKKELIKDLKTILEPIIGYYSKIGSFGDHDSCHGANISWFELFCRSSYGVISYTKASGDNQYLDNFIKTLLRVVEEKQYSSFHDYDQKAVEFVPVATLLLLFRKDSWDLFTREQRESVERYLLNINKVALCNNNWILFRIIVCAILQELTNKDYSKSINNDWQTIDSYYQGDGWYRDGKEGPKDYYNAFGFHFYSLLYYYLFKDNKRKEIIKERSVLFARQFLLFYDYEGRSIPFGRSLIYRYAPLSFWSMMLVNGLIKQEDESRAVLIITKNYSWWQKQNINNQQGFQNLGYAYPNEFMLEAYNSSGSVYWSLKFFMILLAGDNSSIWKEELKEHSTNEGIYTIANGDIIIQKGKLSNTAFINSYKGSGQEQDFAKYMHFAYNSATGFNICKSDNIFNFLSDDSSLIFNINGIKKKRSENLFYACKNNVQEFVWSIDNSMDIVTTVVPLNDFYVRVHIIRSNRVCECYETGFPVKNTSKKTEQIGTNEAIVRDDNIVSFIGMVRGQGIPLVINNEVDSNIYYKDTIMPSLRYVIKKGISVIIDCTGIVSADISSLKIADCISDNIRIIDNSAIIENNGTIIRVPLYFTNSVSKQLFIHKSRGRIKYLVIYIKKTIKRLIKH